MKILWRTLEKSYEILKIGPYVQYLSVTTDQFYTCQIVLDVVKTAANTSVELKTKITDLRFD